MREQALLEKIAQAYRQILGRKLTGIYVHGSIAFGCFRWEKSDIDFLVVVEERLTQQEKEGLIRTLLEFDASAPPKGFEMSVMLRSACAPFQDPTPYELHYSNAYRENYQQDLTGTCQMMQGDDPDLAAHVTVVNSVGITLCGVPREQVFAPVPRASYLHSIWFDIENAPEEICRNPVYYILNLCRVLAFTEEGLVLSKEEGGEWGNGASAGVERCDPGGAVGLSWLRGGSMRREPLFLCRNSAGANWSKCCFSIALPGK